MQSAVIHDLVGLPVVRSLHARVVAASNKCVT